MYFANFLGKVHIIFNAMVYIDLFWQPAGMLTFFILTKGKHPFAPAGRYHEVESRIVRNKPVLSPVNDEVALDMISSMLSADPKKRPQAATLLR